MMIRDESRGNDRGQWGLEEASKRPAIYKNCSFIVIRYKINI